MPSVPNSAATSAACDRGTPRGLATNDEVCSERLRLRDCLRRWHNETEKGDLDTGRYRCRYVVWGQGPPLVCIPGLTGDAISFVMLMARVQSHFRCISYDLPAGSEDGARLMRYRHDDLPSDLFALLDHLRIRQSFVLGISFGASIALAALHRQPGRFTRAVLQGGYAHRRLSAAEVFFLQWLRYTPGRLGHLPLARQIMEQNHREPFLLREPDVWEFFRARQDQVLLRAFASRALMSHRVDLRPRLPLIPHSVLLVHGDRDSLANQTNDQQLYASLPVCARGEIEQCGQQPHLTHPEILAEVIRQFCLPVCAQG